MAVGGCESPAYLLCHLNRKFDKDYSEEIISLRLIVVGSNLDENGISSPSFSCSSLYLPSPFRLGSPGLEKPFES